MARKPRIPSEPVEPEMPAEPLREEEKLPWLQRVEDDEPPSGAGGKLAGYAVGAALLIIVLVAIGYAIVSRQHGLSPNQPEENLASLLPDQSLAGNGQAGNESAAVAPAPRHEPARRREKAGESHKTSPSSAEGGTRAERHKTAKAAHEPRASARAAPAGATRAHQNAPEPRRHEKKAPPPARRAGHEPRRARSGPTDLLQLGAYDSRAAAERVWSGVSRSRPYAGAAHSVERARIHGRVYYRLRVAVPARTWQCVHLHHGRTPCMVVRWAP